MDKKAYQRTAPIVQRSSDDRLENSSLLPDWMKEFAENIQKSAVQPYRQEDNIFDQISSIMNGTRSKYRSVEDAVRDMQERSGLLAYRNKLEAQKKEQTATKTASEGEEIKLFISHPNVKNTFENFIQDTGGELSIPAIINKVRGIHRQDVSDDGVWGDDSLIKFIHEECKKERDKHPQGHLNEMGLGRIHHESEDDVDASNMDAFIALMPVTK
jgi:hypothetical protein